MNEFITKLETLLEMDCNTIKSTDFFRTYENWDSIAVLSLMAMLEDDYNSTISRENFQRLLTIEDLYNYIISK